MNSTPHSPCAPAHSTDLASLVPAVKALVYPARPELLPDFEAAAGRYFVRFARTTGELDAVLRLRFEVFNLELAEGLDDSFLTGRDEDEFDETSAWSGRTACARRRRTSSRGGSTRRASSTWPACPHRSRASRSRSAAPASRASTATRRCFICSGAGLRVLGFLEREGHMHPTFYVPPRDGFECGAVYETVLVGREPELPRLFRTYLRFGAKVCGPPALDRAFRTTDFFVVFDAQRMDAKTRRLFFEG